MKNCLNEYLTKECENCTFWADGANGQTIGCTMIASNMDCVYKRSLWDKFRKTFMEDITKEI